jgi:hypothetical protein
MTHGMTPLFSVLGFSYVAASPANLEKSKGGKGIIKRQERIVSAIFLLLVIHARGKIRPSLSNLADLHSVGCLEIN